jgi:hypothetical protein
MTRGLLALTIWVTVFVGLGVALNVRAEEVSGNPFSFEFKSVEEHELEVNAFITERFKNSRRKIAMKALKLTPVIVEKSLQNGVDPLFIVGLIALESNFQKNAISKIGALGLMQVRCCRQHCKGLDMRKSVDQIIAGMRHINESTAECGSNVYALKHYTTGDCKKSNSAVRSYLRLYSKSLKKFRGK